MHNWRSGEFLGILGIPNESKLPFVHDAYNPSEFMLELRSEQGRRTFAERLIRNPKIGPLQDLCIRALGKCYAPKDMLKSILMDPLQSRIYYDELTVELPIEDCYQIDDQKYWLRVCLAKSPHKTLPLRKIDDCKKLGLSLKLAEKLHNSSADYFDEDGMIALAEKIKEFIYELHIRYLQCLSERAFMLNYVSDTEDDSDDDEISSEEELTLLWAANDRTQEEAEWQKEERARHAARREEKRNIKETRLYRKSQIEKHRAIKRDEEILEVKSSSLKSAVQSQTTIASKEKEKKAAKKSMHLQRRRKDSFQNETRMFDRIFATEVKAEVNETVDARNKKAYFIERTQLNRFPANQNHHLPLSIIGKFSHLETFIIEFNAPELMRNFHTKYFNFSYMDILQLSYGLYELVNLKVFRLRNSRMNAKKLYSVVTVLVKLEKLQVIDFGFDQLKDDCSESISKLMESSSMTHLELESNFISTRVFTTLAEGIHNFKGHLEYLGLARNTIEIKAMRVLCLAMNSNHQVKHLCLSGASISQKAIAECIALELILVSKTLLKIEMTGLRIGQQAAIELISALTGNHTLLVCNVQGSDMPVDIERDIKLLCQRNQYIKKNPYIEDTSRKEHEITEFISQKRHRIYSRALYNAKKSEEFYKQHTKTVTRFSREEEHLTPRPTLITLPKSLKSSVAQTKIMKDLRRAPKVPKTANISAINKRGRLRTVHPQQESGHTMDITSLGVFPSATTIITDDLIYYTEMPRHFGSLYDVASPFHFEPNDLTLEEFHKHVFVPGNEDRYYYFKGKSQSLAKVSTYL